MKTLEKVKVLSPACAAAIWAAATLGCSGESPSTGSQTPSGQGGAGGVGGTGGTAGFSSGTGGVAATGAGTGPTAGSGGASVGTASGMGGSGATSGMGGTGGGASGSGGVNGDCVFTVEHQTADQAGNGGIPTVGIVNWSVDLANLTSASIAFTLDGAASGLTAPVDLTQAPNFRTLLLGMKGSSTYNFQITASDGATTCTSSSYSITTGAVPSFVPRITRTPGPAAASQQRGFIITSTGFSNMNPGGGGGNSYAFIIDADGDPVWWASAPAQCSRAKMSFDGQSMWMAALNVTNMTANGGSVDRVSMDGLTGETQIAGLSNCHHDVTVTPANTVVCPSWTAQPGDQPSDLLELDTNGNVTSLMRLDASVYPGGEGFMGGSNTFHANSVHYHPGDDTFTIADRNPSVVVKVTRQGQPLWQVGGSCANAQAAACVGADWRVNHGHDLSDDGTLLIFNNGESGASAVLNYAINEAGTFTAQQTSSYEPGTTSNVLGDVQELPGGGMLIAFSTAGVIHEIDASGQLVQTINAGTVGYVNWRETLYGPPPRY